MNQVIFFIEKSTGERLYKSDSFWSMSKNHMNAKIHSSENDKLIFFESLCYNFRPYDRNDNLEPWLLFEKLKDVRTYIGSKYGYQKVLTDKHIYNLEKGIEISEPIYYKIITDILDDFTVISEDYIIYNRDTKIGEILN
jgi:hypothetical protein